jgi:tRNA (uracil-5-)-methyltransferase TRM9
MQATTIQKLLQLNAEFYQTFAIQFSDTRQRIQPGVRRLLPDLASAANILDLGCGNGELARELAQSHFSSRYLGLDFSRELLSVARQGISDNPHFAFAQTNLADPDWQTSITSFQSPTSREPIEVRHPPSKFDLVVSFAALHHLPGRETHLQILRTVRNLLAPGGRFIHSNWQFLNSERLRQRLHPWSEIGLTETEVDPGDYLLDWRRGGFGLRYVHHFSEAELNTLAGESGFGVLETFYSDGESSNLGLYQIWEG